MLWDVAAASVWGTELLAVKDGGGCLAFSPDGKTLALSSLRGVFMFHVDLDSWQRIAGEVANRNFTRAEWRQYFPDTSLPSDLPRPARSAGGRCELAVGMGLFPDFL